MQNYALLGITLLLVVVYMLMTTIEKTTSYFGKRSSLNQVEEKYESLRKQRREMLVINYNHYSNIIIGLNQITREIRKKNLKLKSLRLMMN